MAAKVIGSVGAVLKSRAAMARETSRDARAPDAMPMRARRRVLERTLRWTFACGCAERHADADLLGALGDGVGDDAIDAEGGKQSAEGGKCDDEEHEELARGIGVVDQHLDRLELCGGLFRVEIAQCAGVRWRRGLQAARFVRTTSSAPVRTGLGDGIVDLPAGCLLGGFFMHIVHHADDARAVAAVVEHLADGVAVGPIRESGQVLGESPCRS